MIKSKQSFQTLNFPLWVLILFVLVARREKHETVDTINIRLALLDDLYDSLPLRRRGEKPRNLLTGILIRWIMRERNYLLALHTAALLGFSLN